ncbi:MAG TPA: M48 family metallopeptidase [Chitinophagaceae bacterium]
MSSISALYPANPADVPVSLTQPGAAFKKEVLKVMGSILLFFVVYILLIILSVALAAACAYAGVMLIIAAPKFITLMIGLGLIGLGILVVVFLFKFIFAVSRENLSGYVRITEAEQPELFAFIRQITEDTQTHFPKNIFISADVNASVFYNSSFWSMLFPVKKNLVIGLGLVNSVNLSEFKAVMAHEFGHFSQRSMKLGSFVYNVNRVIFNMLFDNKSYRAFINRWAEVDGIFALFARLTFKIVTGIQWILRQMYGFINRNYMGLSRQMEFHADAVSASISGSSNLINALRRIEVANACYNAVIDKYNEWYKQKIVGSNVYPDQQCVMQRFAVQRKLQLDDSGLPVLDEEFFKTSNYSRVNYKDQWASHPARPDREAHLRGLNVDGDTRKDTAWTLFRDKEQLQELLTSKLYDGVEIQENTVTFQPKQFEDRYVREENFYSYPWEYNGFYDGRRIAEFDVEYATRNAVPSQFSKVGFDSIFSNENASLAKKIEFLEADIATMKAIADKSLYAKTFDFDGEKYSRQEAPAVLAKLEAELEQLIRKQKENDESAFRFFYAIALSDGSAGKLKDSYTAMYNRRKEDDVFYNDCNALLDLLKPLYDGEQITHEQVDHIIAELKNNHETKLKNNLRYLSKEGVFEGNAEYSALLKKFQESHYVYFSDGSFFDNEFSEVRQLIFEGCEQLSEYRFKQTKQLLEDQIAICRSRL